MTPAKISYAFTGAFLGTVFVLQWYTAPSYPWIVWILLGAAGVLVPLGVRGVRGVRRVRGVRGNHDEKDSIFFAFLPVCLGIALALFIVSRHAHVPSPQTIDFYADGREVTITGVVSDAPDRRATIVQYTVDAETMNDRPVRGTVLVRDFGGWPPFAIGDALRITGRLERPLPLDDFRYDEYLALHGIRSMFDAGNIRHIGHRPDHRLFGLLIRLRTWFEGRINRLFPEPHASFLAGLLLGSRRGMPADVRDDLQRTGLSHIVAISGYNITIIMNVIGALLAFLARGPRLLSTAFFIALYVLLTGASPSAVRAAIMGVLGLLALQTGRLHAPRLAVLWTAFLMLLWNPLLLWHDAGFQLSFLAVVGLIEAGPVIRPYLAHVPRTMMLRDTLLMTLSAQLFTMPWIALRFGRVALISILTNVLVAPAVPYAMLFGFAGTVVSLALFPLGQLIAYAGWACLDMVLTIASLSARIPLASIEVRGVHPLLIGMIYVFIFLGLRRSQRYKKSDVVLPSQGTRTSFTGFLPGSRKERETIRVPGLSSRSNLGMSASRSDGIR